MKIAKLKLLFVATGLVMGMATQAHASPVFTINPNSLVPGGYGSPNPQNTTADFINGNSSELLNVVGNTLVATQGYLSLTSFSLNSAPISALNSGLQVNYGLYVTFNLVATLSGGTIGTPGSTYSLTSLNYSLWADPQLNNTFTAASSAGTGTQAAVNVVGTDMLLGSGSLIPNPTNGAVLTAAGGAALNSITTYSNTAAGSAFFISPVPFYSVAFNEFNNTGPGVKINGNLISINNASGGLDFNTVPEPATLALLGMGLLGMGVSLRKRKAA